MQKEFLCQICNREYKSYKSLWNHIDLYHKPDKIRMNDSKIKNFSCEHCDKKFTTKQNKEIHVENSCKLKNNPTAKLEKQILELQKEVQLLKSNQENKLLEQPKIRQQTQKNQSTPLIKPNTTNINKIINNGTINNGPVNNIIVINKIGTENISDLNNKELLEIFDKQLECPIKLVEHLNFNKRLPANHNFCSTSLEGKFVQIYNTDLSKQETRPKKYFYGKILNLSIDKSKELYLNNKQHFSKAQQQQIEDRLETLNSIKNRKLNDKILNGLLKELVVLSYNCKDTVLDTWQNNNTSGKKEVENIITNNSISNASNNNELIDNDFIESDSESSDDEFDSNGFLKLKTTKKTKEINV